MSKRPLKLPRWADIDSVDPISGKNNVIEPTEAKKNDGWSYREKPARNWFNWLFRRIYEWFGYLTTSATDPFAVLPIDPPIMRVLVSPGIVRDLTGISQAGGGLTGTFTAPTTNPRIDLVCVNSMTGAVSVITGVEAASPAVPALTTGTALIPVARLDMYVGMTGISKDDITDYRVMYSNMDASPEKDAYAVMRRDSSGRVKVATPATPAGSVDHVVNVDYLNTKVLPAGSSTEFFNATAPNGWTLDASNNNVAIRIVNTAGGGTGGTQNFTAAFATGRAVSGTVATGTVGNTTLTAAQMPAHTHYHGTGTDSSRVNPYVDGGSGGGYNANTSSAGSSNSHNHSLTMNSHDHTIAMDVKYADAIICTKDAY